MQKVAPNTRQDRQIYRSTIGDFLPQMNTLVSEHLKWEIFESEHPRLNGALVTRGGICRRWKDDLYRLRALLDIIQSILNHLI